MRQDTADDAVTTWPDPVRAEVESAVEAVEIDAERLEADGGFGHGLPLKKKIDRHPKYNPNIAPATG